MSLIDTVKTALGGEFTTVKTNRSSYETNGTHTVRRLRNNNVQVEFHDLKTGTSMNFIAKGRLGAMAFKALVDAGVPEDDIQVSDGSFDNRGGQTGVWRPWPSLYVQNTATTTAAPESNKRIDKVESDMGEIKAMLAQLLGGQTTSTDSDGDGPVADEVPANADF